MALDFGSFSRREFLLRGMQVGAGVFAAGALSLCGSFRGGGGGKAGSGIRFGFTTYQWGKDWDIPTLIEQRRIFEQMPAKSLGA